MNPGYASSIFLFRLRLITLIFRIEYERMSRATQSGETVFRDSTEICNKGEARYRVGAAESNQWTLTDEFTSDVCRLPDKYGNGDEYFHFLNSWGTVRSRKTTLSDDYTETVQNVLLSMIQMTKAAGPFIRLFEDQINRKRSLFLSL